MQKTRAQQIERGRELLKAVRHAAMATVNEDGSPHNSPFLFMHSRDLTRIYWGSHPDSEHSKNIMRTGKLFVVLFEATERGGLYIEATNGHPTDGAELKEALAIHNELRAARGQDALALSYYSGDSPQRMWTAEISRLWVNGTTRDADGRIIQDIRTEITAADLLS